MRQSRFLVIVSVLAVGLTACAPLDQKLTPSSADEPVPATATDLNQKETSLTNHVLFQIQEAERLTLAALSEVKNLESEPCVANSESRSGNSSRRQRDYSACVVTGKKLQGKIKSGREDHRIQFTEVNGAQVPSSVRVRGLHLRLDLNRVGNAKDTLNLTETFSLDSELLQVTEGIAEYQFILDSAVDFNLGLKSYRDEGQLKSVTTGRLRIDLASKTAIEATAVESELKWEGTRLPSKKGSAKSDLLASLQVQSANLKFAGICNIPLGDLSLNFRTGAEARGELKNANAPKTTQSGGVWELCEKEIRSPIASLDELFL